MKDPLIGQQLANFRVERLLGQGGMATVYFGQDIKLQRSVAIKVIDKRYKNDPVYASRFVNEARMMAKWRHDNIIQIYYADDTQGYSYYVMEYVDGHDLSTVMSVYADDDELMPISDVLRIGKAIASGLDYAHAQGVVHRDIKPSNVLIAKDRRVLLGDFGMALEVSDGSMGSIFGTPHYISPEQAKRSADAVPQSDLYSLGVVLYEILTGAVPFDDPSPASIALLHITQNPPPPRSINPEIGPAVEKVLLKALEKDPQNRYQTGAKLMAALEEALKAVDAAPKLGLPPLPVGVPTIRRSETSIAQIAKRDVQKAKERVAQMPVAPLPATVRASSRPAKKYGWLYGLIIFLFLLGIGSWYFTRRGMSLAAETATATPTSPPLTLTVEPGQPTQTFAQPSATSTEPQPTESLPTATATLVPTATELPSTETPQASPTAAVVVPTIKYPDGNNFTLFWNETSFHMMYRARAARSFSGIAFERLDENGLPTDKFTGNLWENGNYKVFPTNYCVSIKIYGDEDPPYMDPPDCSGAYASIVQPRLDQSRELFFWNPKAGSTEFRVLWVGEEIARCQISANTCEIYIP